ncbi:hypothetical protein B0J15DRAFT_506020 [Fusarium solani]|jgi:hypothetical protein|uniref:Uncharacterized protein n=1 Tax=Fusarium solani TaxID=169388 RepID=A0A9P9G2Y1_FUSSL|nr:uncharacterized protein B0J15DRAFT_506020 [Fusarium solani]KAH7231483.1 hypothetical protein B0J15DRAFT_506020 [Fusarium solani]
MELAAQCHPEDREWTQNRKFEPSLRYGDDIDTNLIHVPSDNEDWTHVACEDDHPCSNRERIAPHIDSIFIEPTFS